MHVYSGCLEEWKGEAASEGGDLDPHHVDNAMGQMLVEVEDSGCAQEGSGMELLMEMDDNEKVGCGPQQRLNCDLSQSVVPAPAESAETEFNALVNFSLFRTDSKL